MIRTVVGLAAACVMMNATRVAAQPVRAVPRPPAQAPGPPRPEDGSAAPDGYAPIPQWLGQTRAPRPAKSAAFDVDLMSVTGVLGGTVTCCEPPAYRTSSADAFALATLPFDIRAGDAAPFVIREPATAPFVIRLPVPPVLCVIMRLPSPSPRSASGKM